MKTAKMYNPPSSSIFLVDWCVDSSTEIISIRTPMAHGLMESIAAAPTTVAKVGR
jgi:hypothetical protein